MGALAAAKHFLEVVKDLDCEVCFIKKRVDMQSMLDKHGASYKKTETISQMKASLWERLFSGRSPLTEEAIQKRLIQGGFLEAVSEGTSLKEGVIFLLSLGAACGDSVLPPAIEYIGVHKVWAPPVTILLHMCIHSCVCTYICVPFAFTASFL